MCFCMLVAAVCSVVLLFVCVCFFFYFVLVAGVADVWLWDYLVCCYTLMVVYCLQCGVASMWLTDCMLCGVVSMWFLVMVTYVNCMLFDVAIGGYRTLCGVVLRPCGYWLSKLLDRKGHGGVGRTILKVAFSRQVGFTLVTISRECLLLLFVCLGSCLDSSYSDCLVSSALMIA